MASNTKKKIVIGNWKMNLTVPESTVLAERLKKEVVFFENTEAVVCPSFLSIYPINKVLEDSPVKIGAQNIFYEEAGNFTGEISASMIRGFGEYVILGHSERRRFLGEEDKDIAKKVRTALLYGIKPIICIGETLHEKDEGVGKIVVTSQLESALSFISSKELEEIIIAYEPVWSISPSELICSPKDASSTIKVLKNLIRALYGDKALEKTRFLYGGSVDDKNAKEFLKEKDIDGFLVGGASLDHKKFLNIIKETEKAAKK